MSETAVLSDEFYPVLLQHFTGLPSIDDFPFIREIVVVLRPQEIAAVWVSFAAMTRTES